MDIFSGEISTLYHVIDINLRQIHPSTAAGRYLDLIGQMLGVLRRENETDENYLYRIAHRWDEAATSNEMAVRLTFSSGRPGVGTCKCDRAYWGQGHSPSTRSSSRGSIKRR